MSTATLPSVARLNVALFTLADGHSFKPKMHFGKSKNPAGEEVDALFLEDVPVFRSGTFRDSQGFQHTWEHMHMDQMVSHFDLLKSRSIFKDVPVRKGHGALFGDPIDGLIGWHTRLRTELRTNQVDGEEQLYLLGNYEILDPDAMTKISSGLWRNVSAEVGTYLTNNETEFWPVYQGVAYVDISAVEGLSSFSKQPGVGERFSIMLPAEKEAPVSGNDNNGTQPQGTQAPPAVPAAPQMDPAMFARANYTFTIGGAQSQDFAKVQLHIDTLETAANEAKTANRSAFIKGLAEGPAPKILAPQIEGIEKYAMKLDDESWTAFEASWGVAGQVPHTSQHGAAPTPGQTPASTPQGTPAQGAAADEIEIAEGIVMQHRRGNMKADHIKATASYKKLLQTKPDSPALAGL